MHKDETDPELMFQDWSDIPEGFIDECFIAPQLWDVMDEIDSDEWDAFCAWCEIADLDFEKEDGEDIAEKFRESYQAGYDTLGEFAEYELPRLYGWDELLEKLPEKIRGYVDLNWENVARDWGYRQNNGFVFNCRN
jgi:antirestriction protein